MSRFGEVAALIGGALWRAEQGPRHRRGCDPVRASGRSDMSEYEGAAIG